MNRHQESPGLLFGAIAVAMLLTVMPLAPALEPLRPYWVALVLIYWSLELSQPVSLGAAFLTGLVLDLVTASLMGMHALGLVVIVYLVRHFRARMRFFPPWQQALAVLALLINDRIITLWITVLLGEPVPTWHYWLAPLVGIALWPWIFLLMDRLRLRRRQANRP